MLEANVDGRAKPAPAAHPDTDAQHSWILRTFGINTRDPSHGAGWAAGRPQAGAGGAPGTGHSLPGTPLGRPAHPDAAALEARLTALLTPFKDRVSAFGDPGVIFARTFETQKAYKGYQDLVEAAVHAATAGGSTDASTGKIEAAVKGLERLVADLPEKGRAATDEAAKINGMTDAALLNTGAAQKVRMVETLLAAGKPAGAVRAAQIKAYKAMLLDPGFMRADEERGRQIAADLKGDAELEEARDTWATRSDDEKLQALRKVVAAQSKHLGIAPPEVVAEHVPAARDAATGQDDVTAGDFNEDDGKLYINMDSSSPISDFEFALNTAIHENAHNYQKQLVQKLDAGTLQPGTPDYIQATMFRVNRLEPGGYIPGDVLADLPAYGDQPLERHSLAVGPATAAEILKVL